MTIVRPERVASGDERAGGPAADGSPGRRPSPRRIARVASALVRQLRRALARIVVTWQRSLQLRVATTTVVITGAVVLVIGIFIVDEVSDGVLHAKKDASIRQADIGLADAQTYLTNAESSLSSPADQAGFQSYVTTANPNSAGLFSVAVLGSSLDASGGPPIPKSLQRVVLDGNIASQYAQAPRPGGGGTSDVLIVGAPVDESAGVGLYYFFPLTAETQTISLLQRTVLLAGLGLVLLVVAITLLVTRQVVRPVRVAARTAGRLAAGELSQRISVRGSDDIARLGRSFNDMAGSLQRQIRRLEDLSRLQRRFTSDVSHELRTPLTTIRMAAEFLHAQREDLDPAMARSAELLRAELDRFESLLTDLLEISRHDAGVAHLEAEPADIRGVVTSTVDASQILADRHGSDVIANLPAEPVVIDMDTRRVERILRNLLGNALDHGEGRPVEVTVGYDADAVAVTVRDHGVGLKPGEAGLVFNRFWRGDPSRSRLTGGTGLGLAISLEDARLHDGWLQAWGERGQGAQFRLTLPRRAGHMLVQSPLPLSPHDSEDD